MIRRNFLRGLSLFGASGVLEASTVLSKENTDVESNDRAYWTALLTRIASPVLKALSENKLIERMPVEAAAGALETRKKVTYLEALARTLAGMAPWLELGADATAEGKLRSEFIELSILSIRNAVTPASVSFMNFTEGGQPLVDAAFLSHALLRAPKQLWGNLGSITQQHLIAALQATRVIKPPNNNWLLFSAMVETALLKFDGNHDATRVDYAVNQIESWYKGDSVYGDGPEFHFDYYNSFVVHPMLMDVVTAIPSEAGSLKGRLEIIEQRARRYAEIQERLISPEGAFPPVGRSITYRCGAFQLLAQMALQKKLPLSLPPSQVRSALTAVIKRSMEAHDTFDSNGWLTIGFCGHQAGVGENYITTGSLYLCTLAFLPLGLSSSDAFWTGPTIEWTSKKAYSGKEFHIDKAL